MKKAGARKALKFFEENYIMICGLETKNEAGCTDKCLEILKKHAESTTVTQQNVNKNFNVRNMELETEVNVEKLIDRFKEMARRDVLLVGEHITRQDLLVQIVGVIVTEAMQECDKGGSKQ